MILAEEICLIFIIAFFAGLHISIWGFFKDAPYEGYSLLRFLRSTIIAVLISPGIYFFANLNLFNFGEIIVFFGAVYVIERAITEFYKTFVRVEDQSKYTIPMSFHIFGRVIKGGGKRILIGILYAAIIFIIVALLHYIDELYLVNNAIILLILGSTGGFISAIGGAWKDAPIEGFHIFKFFRSPIVSAMYAYLLSFYTSNLLLIIFPALGYTIATLETYKTFFFPNKVRGKFAGKKILYPDVLNWRWIVTIPYSCIWVMIIYLFLKS